jgi:hypothetical protein
MYLEYKMEARRPWQTINRYTTILTTAISF